MKKPNSTPVRRATHPCFTKLKKVQIILLYLLIPSLFFSYHPRITLGATDAMNLEFSLPLILLALYALLSLPSAPQNVRNLYISIKSHFDQQNPSRPLSASQKAKSSSKKAIFALLLLFAFPVYLTASILWSSNPLRATLTSGIGWCLILTILTFPNLMSNYKTKHKLVKIFLYSSLAIAAFCWLQCILDLFQVDRAITLFCEGCTYRSFGFPHPNGFAIEPQFMGNLLLAPIFLSLYQLFRQPTHHYRRFFISFFLITTLFLTFSRGAIYAFLLASAVLLVIRLIQSRSRHPLLLIPLILSAFLTTLCAQGLMAELSPTNDTFATGIMKSLDQLTLGRLHLAPLTDAAAEPVDEASSEAFESQQSSTFSGYVPESTNVRVRLTNLALDRWDNDPASLLIGTGLGSAGTALAQTFPDITSPKQIIQNQYASLLLELGLVGALLLLISLITTIKILPSPHKIPRTYLIALTLAYLVTLFFFSGFPNALHIYLLPILTYWIIIRKKFVS